VLDPPCLFLVFVRRGLFLFLSFTDCADTSAIDSLFTARALLQVDRPELPGWGALKFSIFLFSGLFFLPCPQTLFFSPAFAAPLPLFP